MLFVHSGYVDLRLQIGKVKLLRERWNVLERKDLSRSIDAFLGLVRRYFNLSLHKVYSCIIVTRVDMFNKVQSCKRLPYLFVQAPKFNTAINCLFASSQPKHARWSDKFFAKVQISLCKTQYMLCNGKNLNTRQLKKYKWAQNDISHCSILILFLSFNF